MLVRAMLTLSVLQKLHTKSVDLFLAYTQADVKSEIYMEIPLGFIFDGDHPGEWLIMLDKNLYDLKDSGLVWFEKPKEFL